MSHALPSVRAYVFDVFGTVVDWRSGIAREAGPFLARHRASARGSDDDASARLDDDASARLANDASARGSDDASAADPGAFADAWRRRYGPAMEEVRRGRRPFVRLDVLHRENLEAVLPEFGIDPHRVPEAELAALTHAWHRLDPWPDCVAGLTRLKRHAIIAPLSNGNIILMVNMARRAGLPWDAILGAEVVQAYKPMPDAYLRTAELLAMQPDELCMVAAHPSDLAAARACGLRTCFVPRPLEHGQGGPAAAPPALALPALAPQAVAALQDWDLVVRDLGELADRVCGP